MERNYGPGRQAKPIQTAYMEAAPSEQHANGDQRFSGVSKSHMEKVHPFTCHTCNFQFKNLLDLETHTRTCLQDIRYLSKGCDPRKYRYEQPKASYYDKKLPRNPPARLRDKRKHNRISGELQNAGESSPPRLKHKTKQNSHEDQQAEDVGSKSVLGSLSSSVQRDYPATDNQEEWYASIAAGVDFAPSVTQSGGHTRSVFHIKATSPHLVPKNDEVTKKLFHLAGYPLLSQPVKEMWPQPRLHVRCIEELTDKQRPSSPITSSLPTNNIQTQIASRTASLVIPSGMQSLVELDKGVVSSDILSDQKGAGLTEALIVKDPVNVPSDKTEALIVEVPNNVEAPSSINVPSDQQVTGLTEALIVKDPVNVPSDRTEALIVEAPSSINVPSDQQVASQAVSTVPVIQIETSSNEESSSSDTESSEEEEVVLQGEAMFFLVELTTQVEKKRLRRLLKGLPLSRSQEEENGLRCWLPGSQCSVPVVRCVAVLPGLRGFTAPRGLGDLAAQQLLSATELRVLGLAGSRVRQSTACRLLRECPCLEWLDVSECLRVNPKLICNAYRAAEASSHQLTLDMRRSGNYKKGWEEEFHQYLPNFLLYNHVPNLPK